MLEKASHRSLVEGAIEQIEESIVDRTFKTGEKLPSPQDLQESLGISRGTLRETLRVLEQKGLIEIKPGVGGGAVVKAVTTRQVSESLALLLRFQKVSLRDLAEFREGVEGIVASLAAERAKREDIKYLKQLLTEAKTFLEGGVSDWAAFIQVDNQVHMGLARIARNPVYESFLQTVYNNIYRYFDQYLPREAGLLRENYQNLCEIVRAVEKGESAKARLLVQNHVYRFNRLMEEKAQQTVKGKFNGSVNYLNSQLIANNNMM